MILAVVVGLVWGVFCGVVSDLPVLTTLAQMAVPWVWVAAVVAFLSASSMKHAALLGGIALLAANVAYFVVGAASNSFAGLSPLGGLQFFALWAVVGLVMGPIAGVAGWWLTVERRRLVAVVALGGLTIAEPMALWPHIDHVDAHMVYLGTAVGGLAVPLVWFRGNWRKALKALALVLALVYPIALMLEAALIWFGQISPPMRLA